MLFPRLMFSIGMVGGNGPVHERIDPQQCFFHTVFARMLKLKSRVFVLL